jgi:hypothetical protein
MIIRSRLENSVELRIHEMRDNGDGIGVKVARQVGDGVVLKPGVNQVDDAWWRQWSSDNIDNPLHGHFAIVEEPAPTPPPPPPPSSGLFRKKRG